MRFDETSGALLERWQNEGDTDALDEILNGEVEVLRRRIGGGPGQPYGTATVADVAQEAVYRMLDQSPSPVFENHAALRAYLLTTARRLIVDRMRRQAPFRPLGTTVRGGLASPEETQTLDRSDDHRALRAALDGLGREDCEVLRRFYFEGQGVAEIAGVLRISSTSVSRRLRRARARLARRLDTERGKA